jgi:hypothetical protein
LQQQAPVGKNGQEFMVGEGKQQYYSIITAKCDLNKSKCESINVNLLI